MNPIFYELPDLGYSKSKEKKYQSHKHLLSASINDMWRILDIITYKIIIILCENISHSLGSYNEFNTTRDGMGWEILSNPDH